MTATSSLRSRRSASIASSTSVASLYGQSGHASKLRNLVALQNRGKQSFRDLRDLLSAELAIDPGSLRFEQHFIEHHLAHIASAFYPSGLSAAAGLSNDGSGDFVSMMTADCEDTRI